MKKTIFDDYIDKAGVTKPKKSVKKKKIVKEEPIDLKVERKSKKVKEPEVETEEEIIDEETETATSDVIVDEIVNPKYDDLVCMIEALTESVNTIIEALPSLLINEDLEEIKAKMAILEDNTVVKKEKKLKTVNFRRDESGKIVGADVEE